jgi:LysR family transcriptional regulator, hca operon transcriptional activator
LVKLDFLPWSVVSRPLLGAPPTVELAVGYNRRNTSPVLKLFLGRVDELIARFQASRGKKSRA